MTRLGIDTATVSRIREALGAGFSQHMVASISERLDVDVLVIDLTGDAYTMKVAGRHVLVTKRTLVWPRQNFSLAHELGHIASGTLHSTVGECDASTEAEANSFAAELLMPQTDLRGLDWESMNIAELANHVWNYGVSTEALANRLASLRLPVSSNTASALAQNTFSLLRRSWVPAMTPDQADPITLRRERSAQRHIPIGLISHLEAAVLAGKAPKESLAFLLDIPVGDLDLEVEESSNLGDDIALLEEIL